MRRAVGGRGPVASAPRAQSPPLGERATGADAALLWGARAALLAVLLIPLLVTSNSMFPYVVGKALFARAAIEVGFALWLILLIRNPAYRPAKSWVIAAFAGWLIVSLAASFAGVSLTRSLWSSYERMQGVVDLAHWFAFALAAAAVFRTLADWRLLFTVNLAVCGAASALGLARYYEITDWTLATVREGRIESLLGNATFLGAYTVVSLLIGIGMLLQSFGRGRTPAAQERRDAGNRAARRSRRARNRADAGLGFDATPWLRALWAASALLAFWAMWFTGSRGAMAGLVAGGAVFAGGYALWGAPRRIRRALLAGLAAAFAAGILLIAALLTSGLPSFVERAFSAAPTLQRLASISGQETSILGRIEAYETAADAFRARPLLGWGPENYLVAWGLHSAFDEAIEVYDQAHNKALEALVATGGVGLLAYLTLWGTAAWALLRAARRREGGDRMLALGVAAAAAAYFVQNLFLFDSPATAMLFATLTAFAAREEAQARAASGTEGRWLPARLGRIAPLGTAGRILGAPAGRTALIALIAALTALLTLFLAFRPYAAAVDTARADMSDSWRESEEYFERAIEGFPPLANYPRVYMMRHAWENIERLTDAEFVRAVNWAVEEGERALALEPRNWWIHANLAQFHQTAALRDARRLESARAHVDSMLRLAPRTNFTADIAARQERIEEAFALQSGAPG